MLTARAEYRLRLRANNAGTRLTPLGLELGCIGPERADWFARRQADKARHTQSLEATVSGHELVAAGLPVRAEASMASITRSTRPSSTAASMRTLGKKSTTYSAPR